jgi:hypothetical protein
MVWSGEMVGHLMLLEALEWNCMYCRDCKLNGRKTEPGMNGC